MRNPYLLVTAVIVLVAPLAACATDGPAYRAPVASGYGAAVAVHREDDGLLPEPPADAKAGQCFAKVVVPGQPVYGPPTLQSHARWVQSPPQPGTIGPVWCQVWEQGYQPTVTYTPERYGWIRVICDHDATVEKIGHIQHRLHDWGYYQGGYGGKYDDATAEAVKRFQAEHHIEHGGYLSYRTMEALEAAPPAPVGPPPVSYAQGYQAGGYQAGGYAAFAQQQGYAQQGYAVAPPVQPQVVMLAPRILPPIYQQGAAYPQAYGQAPCPGSCPAPAPQPCAYNPCQGGYGQPVYGQPGGYGQAGYGYERRWLTWPGKSGY